VQALFRGFRFRKLMRRVLEAARSGLEDDVWDMGGVDESFYAFPELFQLDVYAAVRPQQRGAGEEPPRPERKEPAATVPEAQPASPLPSAPVPVAAPLFSLDALDPAQRAVVERVLAAQASARVADPDVADIVEGRGPALGHRAPPPPPPASATAVGAAGPPAAAPTTEVQRSASHKSVASSEGERKHSLAEEWGFKDPATAAAMMRRAQRFTQAKKKKKHVDPMKRCARREKRAFPPTPLRVTERKSARAWMLVQMAASSARGQDARARPRAARKPARRAERSRQHRAAGRLDRHGAGARASHAALAERTTAAATPAFDSAAAGAVARSRAASAITSARLGPAPPTHARAAEPQRSGPPHCQRRYSTFGRDGPRAPAHAAAAGEGRTARCCAPAVHRHRREPWPVERIVVRPFGEVVAVGGGRAGPAIQQAKHAGAPGLNVAGGDHLAALADREGPRRRGGSTRGARARLRVSCVHGGRAVCAPDAAHARYCSRSRQAGEPARGPAVRVPRMNVFSSNLSQMGWLLAPALTRTTVDTHAAATSVALQLVVTLDCPEDTRSHEPFRVSTSAHFPHSFTLHSVAINSRRSSARWTRTARARSL
jgi:hypothetical protein